MPPETLQQYFCSLIGEELIPTVIDWPPDAFALVAFLLEKTGAYTAVADNWPPLDVDGHASWSEYIAAIAQPWRSTASNSQQAPAKAQELWSFILANQDKPTAKLTGSDRLNQKLRNTLLTILAAADEACADVGIPGGSPPDKFEDLILRLLQEQRSHNKVSTLCKAIATEKLLVLPKLHTPQTGITIRSLSHNITAFCGSEVMPEWHWVNHAQLHNERHGLNVLVLPWPLNIEPCHFSSAQPVKGSISNLPKRFGFFDYRARGGMVLDFKLIERLIQTATKKVGTVDVVVFPELALRSEDIPSLIRMIVRMPGQPILIGGLCMDSEKKGGLCRNTSVTLIPLASKKSAKTRVFPFYQDKHHRWLFDGRQVQQYGLGCTLDPEVDWWEHSLVSQRKLGFVSIQTWLTLCTLICEDLARPDPIANMVRAVGPNLVIALLLDGPQISKRWPARYGTVLAEDPGSSVLTVSPLGMVRLSRPRGISPSNVVALWKDALSGEPIEISLPEGNQGLLLSLTRIWREEFTADGRSDDRATAYLTLSGVHPISA
jgi:hypothetical protein